MAWATALLALTTAAIVALWAWLGLPVPMPQSPLGAGDKLYCISYAPFRGDQSPFGPDVPIDPTEIDRDLAQLKQLTNCVRTYSVDHGLDRIAEIAARHGMKVLQGLWLSGRPELSRKQVETAIALAQRFPDVITGVVVGNEVLLRGEMSALELLGTIREVKARVSMPVTYADVWEFWLRYREVASAVDFVTIHILPYWEDFPIGAAQAAAHVEAIRSQLVAAFPKREILVGEFGWPSAGRMRAGALPSPANQAQVIHEVLARAQRGNYRVNLIEAYDQPWKRQLEGTVGGHWGLYDAYSRQRKFAWNGAVSDHPYWRWQAAGGGAMAALVFAIVFIASGRASPQLRRAGWLRSAAIALGGGFPIGWTVANVPLESLTPGDWIRSLSWAAVGLATPVLGAAALATGITLPRFAGLLGRPARPAGRLPLWLGLALIATAVLSLQAALGLVFDPRYRDFPFAPLTGAVLPLAVLPAWAVRTKAPIAERAMATALALSAIYIAFNEGFANWQALWFAAGLILLALTLLQVRDAPG